MDDERLNFHLKNDATIDVDQAYRVVTPKSLHYFWENDDIPEDEFPEALSLRIAEEEDTAHIEKFFQSKRKQEADPDNFIKPRPEDPVRNLSQKGQITLIEDHNEDITAICFAFTHHVNGMPKHELQQDHTEIGTVLSCAKGLGLTSITISALALAIKEKKGHDHPIIAKVSKENKAANGLFGTALKWDVTEKTDEIMALFKSSAGDTMKQDEPTTPHEETEIAESRNWYVFDEAAEENARALLYAIKKDKNIHTKAGIAVPFEFDKEDFDISFDHGDRIPNEYWTNTVNVDPEDPDAIRIADLYNENIDGDNESDRHLVNQERQAHIQEEEYTEINDITDTAPGPFEKLDISRKEEEDRDNAEIDAYVPDQYKLDMA